MSLKKPRVLTQTVITKPERPDLLKSHQHMEDKFKQICEENNTSQMSNDNLKELITNEVLEAIVSNIENHNKHAQRLNSEYNERHYIYEVPEKEWVQDNFVKWVKYNEKNISYNHTKQFRQTIDTALGGNSGLQYPSVWA